MRLSYLGDYVTKFVVIIFAGSIFFVGSLRAQNKRLLGSARKILVQSDVVFNKDRKYNSKPISYAAIVRSGLLKSFQEVESNPDIIVKFHKDVFLIDSETISITVFDAEDNGVIFSEERTLVDEENDVNRLVAHFLNAVRAQRITQAEAIARKGTQSRNTGQEIIVSIYSRSDSLVKTLLESREMEASPYHIVFQGAAVEDDADVVLIEKIRNGIPTLVLVARDTRKVLHTEIASDKSLGRSIALMAKWISTTNWE